MSGPGGFLDRLAVRQVSPSIGVRARVPSRFADGSRPALVEEEAVPLARSDSAPEMSPVAEPRSPDRAGPNGARAARRSGPAGPIRSLALPERSAEPRTRDGHASEPGRAVIAPVATHSPAARERSRETGSERGERGAQRMADPAEPATPAPALPAPPRAEPEPNSPQRLVAIADDSASPPRVRSDLLVEVAREVPAVPSVPQAAAPIAGRRDQGPPDVTVSIGRIEVRAITDAPATPAPLPAVQQRPTLSLEEYLERRHGAARR